MNASTTNSVDRTERKRQMGLLREPAAARYQDGMNLYEFVRGEPLDMTDPEGESGQKHKPATQPSNGNPKQPLPKRDPNAWPAPGQETTVIIQADLGLWYNALWRLHYYQMINAARRSGERCDCYPSGLSKQKFLELIADPNVTRIQFIGHGSDGDGPGIIWLNDDLRNGGLVPSEVKEVLGKSTGIKDVTLRSCYQGNPISRKDWEKAFNLPPGTLRSRVGPDKAYLPNP